MILSLDSVSLKFHLPLWLGQESIGIYLPHLFYTPLGVESKSFG